MEWVLLESCFAQGKPEEIGDRDEQVAVRTCFPSSTVADATKGGGEVEGGMAAARKNWGRVDSDAQMGEGIVIRVMLVALCEL